jgi:hypothetical protein
MQTDAPEDARTRAARQKEIKEFQRATQNAASPDLCTNATPAHVYRSTVSTGLLRSRRSGLRSTVRRRVRLFLFLFDCFFRLCLARRRLPRASHCAARRSSSSSSSWLIRIDETPVRLPQLHSLVCILLRRVSTQKNRGHTTGADMTERTTR